MFSDTGGGHRAAAQALEQALHTVDPDVRASTADPLLQNGSAVVRQLTSLYSPIINRARPAWGAVYHTSNTRAAFAAVRAVFGRQVRSVVSELLSERDPDVVLSVHPLLNHVSYQAIRSSSRPRGLMTVVTDLVDLHRGWIFPRSDLIVVPTEKALLTALRRRAEPDRVRMLGLPIDLRFRPPALGEKAALRRFFGLREDLFTILISGGGTGSGRIYQQVKALARDSNPWQLVVVCGHNLRLRRQVQRAGFATPAVCFGFVDSMPELMRVADVVVGKAGPGTIGEALATGIPIVVTAYLPGQETENVDFVVNSGLGLYAPSARKLNNAIAQLADPAASLLEELTRRALAISRPYACLDIARECLGLARVYQASGQASR